MSSLRSGVLALLALTVTATVIAAPPHGVPFNNNEPCPQLWNVLDEAWNLHHQYRDLAIEAAEQGDSATAAYYFVLASTYHESFQQGVANYADAGCL